MGQRESLQALEQQVYQHIPGLPMPVAVPLRVAQIASDAGAAVEALVEAGEALVTFLGVVALLDAAAEGQSTPVFASRHAAAPTMGAWRTALEALASKPRRPTVPALADAAGRRRRRAWLGAAGHLTKIRNVRAHTPQSVFRAQVATHHHDLLAALAGLLDDMAWLDRYVVLRVEGRDDVSGALRVRPLVGHDPKRSAVTLTWPDAPPANQVVLLEAELPGRWLSLNPLYRWADDTLLAYSGTHRGLAKWHAVDGTGHVVQADRSPDDWLLAILASGATRRGQVELPAAERRRLRQVGTPTQFLEQSGRVPAPPKAPAPLGKRRRSGVAIAVGVVLGALLCAGWLLRDRLPWVSPAPAVSAPQATAEAPSPEAGLKAVIDAYNARDLVAMRGLYADTLEYFYERRGYPSDALFKVIKGSKRRHTHRIEVLARKGDEALLCERRTFERREGPADSDKTFVVYLGLRRQAEGWRVFAEGGHHPAKKPAHPGPYDSSAVEALRARFGLPKPLTTLGDTPCGPSDAKPVVQLRPPIRAVTSAPIRVLPGRLKRPAFTPRSAPELDRRFWRSAAIGSTPPPR